MFNIYSKSTSNPTCYSVIPSVLLNFCKVIFFQGLKFLFKNGKEISYKWKMAEGRRGNKKEREREEKERETQK